MLEYKVLVKDVVIFSNPVDADFRSWFLMVPAAVVTVSLSTVKWFLNTGLKNDLHEANRSHAQTMATNAESLRLFRMLAANQTASLVAQRQLHAEAISLREQAEAAAARLPKLRENLDACEVASVRQDRATVGLLVQLADVKKEFKAFRAVGEEVQSGIKNLSVQMTAEEIAEAARQQAIDDKMAELKRVCAQSQANIAAAIDRSKQNQDAMQGMARELARQNAERERRIALSIQAAITSGKLLAPDGDSLLARLARGDKS